VGTEIPFNKFSVIVFTVEYVLRPRSTSCCFAACRIGRDVIADTLSISSIARVSHA